MNTDQSENGIQDLKKKKKIIQGLAVTVKCMVTFDQSHKIKILKYFNIVLVIN